jgi:ribosomal protein S18 acetylase RimI-like enzyme
LYLREAFRGRRLGKAAILHMIAICRRERIKTLHLEVEQGNERARLVYERLGFAPDDSLMMHYEID